MIYRNAEALKQAGMTTVVSVGRRQPLHRVHLDCLREIVEAGFKLIVVHGSVNPPDHRFYDPVENPLTYAELTEQTARVLPGVSVTQFALQDRGDAVLWSRDLAALLGDKISKSAVHYRRKKSETTGAIVSLDKTVQALQAVNFSVWESRNRHAGDDDVHAHDLRELDLNALSPTQENVFADAEYIRTLAEQARAEHPEKNTLPLSMLDLSLHRAWKECGISFSAASSIAETKEILRGKLQQHRAKANP